MDKTRAAIVVIVAAVAIGVGISLAFQASSNPPVVPPPSNNIPPPTNNGNNNTDDHDNFSVLPDSNPPVIRDATLRVEKVIEGLSAPTSMTFLDRDDLMIVQKDNGRVRHVSNGALQPASLLEVSVRNNSERGLLGLAVADRTGTSDVFLYFTEESNGDTRNRVYRYDWSSQGIMGRTLLLDLPGTPGPNHDGGKITLGPDGLLYVIIGDLNRDGMLQNFRNGPSPDDTSVIIRVDRNGMAAGNAPLSDSDPAINDALATYYAYGIRNSFGMDFDPLTDTLWDTENGPADYDEINVVQPGFNSGWQRVMGPIERTDDVPDDLVSFEGSKYSDPAFSWRQAEGITDIEFLNSTKLGDRYSFNIFVGDINNGNIYFFTVNDEREGITADGAGLQDLVADNRDEVSAVTFGTGFGGITDIETGPDGYLYILTFGGDLYRIVPAQ
ncbi:MAG TPA: PQQ-dependent sugar dehydrogenase [Nitrososphaera sp.]|jgi:glucose/arabinose dehydrogenase